MVVEFPPLSTDDREALVAWLTYSVRTEEHDRLLPGGWSRIDPDCWMPAPEACADSARFARRERGEAIRACAWLDMAAVARAQRQVFDMTYTSQKALLTELTC